MRTQANQIQRTAVGGDRSAVQVLASQARHDMVSLNQKCSLRESWSTPIPTAGRSTAAVPAVAEPGVDIAENDL